MSAVPTARNLSRKRRLLLPLTVLLCAAGLLLWLHHRAGLSPYTGQPSDQFLCTADADRYPLDTEQITFHVSNIGGYAEELDKPCLEMQKGGVWYSVPPTDQTGETANLLYVSPETNCQGLFHQIHKKSKKGVRSTVGLLTPRLIDYIFPFSRSLQRYA